MSPVDPNAEPSGDRPDFAALLGTLSSQLLRLEDRPDSELLARTAASAEELAGVARALSPEIAGLAEAIRSVVLAASERRIACDASLAADLLAAVDLLSARTGSPGTDGSAISEMTARLLSADRPAFVPTVGKSESDWPEPGGAISPDLLAQFVTESVDSLGEAEAALLELEGQGDPADSLHRLFRAVHSIKGTAGYVGLRQICRLSHVLESMLSLVRGGQLSLANGISEFVFQGVDHLKGMVAGLTPAGESPRDLSAFVSDLGALCEQASSGSFDEMPPAETAFQMAAVQYLDGLTDGLKSVSEGDCSEEVLAQLRRSATSLRSSAAYVGRTDVDEPTEELLVVLERLSRIRERLAASVGCFGPPAASEAETPKPPPVVVLPETPVPAPVQAAMPREPEPPAVPAAVKTPAPGTADSQAGTRPVAGTGKSMRVDQRKLDEYVNLAGELVIARNTLVHALKQSARAGVTDRGMKDAVEKVCRIIGDVQNNAMGMRMIPVGTIFQRFPRLVRDVAKTLGKQIDLELRGEETELDKQVAEALSDPLVHLVRNAADHGVETPEIRRSAGKRDTGVITLSAGREGNTILIDIRDDGAGIDADRLRAKAVSSGVISEEQSEAMTREQALELIFAPGLSTARVVSDLSGRGVGMDVVRSNISALGGRVTIKSEPNEGTLIRLSLPLTLAVTNVVLVESSGMTYGLPMDVVRETLKVRPADFKRLRGVRAVTVRGELIPVKSLDSLLGSTARRGTESHASQSGNERLPVVVLNVLGQRFGVIVDVLRGQQEIVLKPVPAQLGHIDGIGGATIMGDGGIVLVLDPAGLYRRALTASEPELLAG